MRTCSFTLSPPPNTCPPQELPQFFSAPKTVRAPVPKMDLSYKGDVSPRRRWKKEEISSRRSEDVSQKEKVDKSKVNKEQRGSSRQANAYAAGIGSARQLVRGGGGRGGRKIRKLAKNNKLL